MAVNIDRIDRAILAYVRERAGEHGISIKKIMDGLKATEPHLAEGRSMRQVQERIYQLRKDGALIQLGMSRDTRYALPSQPTTEAQRQVADARQRQPAPAKLAKHDTAYVFEPVVEVEYTEGGTVPPADVQPTVEIEPAPVVAKPAPLTQRPSFRIDLSALAGDVASQVALTVERVVGQDVRRLEAMVSDLQRENERLKTENGEYETLYNDLDAEHKALKQRVATALGLTID